MTPGRPLSAGVLEPDALGAAVLALRRDGPAPRVWLSAREQTVLTAFEGYAHRRDEWLSGRAVAKQLLREAFGLEPERVEVLPAESGAPLLQLDGALHPTLTLNLSHTDRWVVAVAAPFSVGVDVADDEDGLRLPRIASRVFSEGEAEECGAHLSAQRQAAVWAIKEAGLKLRIGGVFSPGARSVRVQSLSPVRVEDPTLEIELFRVEGAAIAVARERR